MAGWLRGRVKEVVSGDTVVIVGGTQGLTVPQEKRLTLSSLIAPRLVCRSLHREVGCVQQGDYKLPACPCRAKEMVRHVTSLLHGSPESSCARN